VKQETYAQQMKDSDTIFTAISTGDFENFSQAEQAVVMLYVTDAAFSRAGISHALKRLERFYAQRSRAPWSDFNGKDIHEGDTIEHPSGERGKVVFLAHESDPGDQWRVNYGTGDLSRLCLQIGDKGRAVVVTDEIG